MSCTAASELVDCGGLAALPTSIGFLAVCQSPFLQREGREWMGGILHWVPKWSPLLGDPFLGGWGKAPGLSRFPILSESFQF